MKANPLQRIKPLGPQLANQIAAGEVIERPAAAIKELVENSLDAGAQTIEVELTHGGTELIRVRDDGAGIVKEDLVLAVSRHATSKITSLADLESVASLGFRGEALASIASVSHFSLTSRHEQAQEAFRVSVDGRDCDVQIELAAHPVGTTTQVRQLFFNTPARRRFLRTDKTEFFHCETVIKRLALCHFSVAFLLKHNGRVILNCKPARTEAEKLERLRKIMGRQFIEQALEISMEGTELALTGWVEKPGAVVGQGQNRYFYINGRMVQDKVVTHAVKQAYAEVLPTELQASYVLSLTIDPSLVDVNVHPTKHEVRFSPSRLVHDFIVSSLRRVFTTSDVPAAVSWEEGMMNQPTPVQRLAAQLPAITTEPLAPSTAKTTRFGVPFGQVGSFLLTRTETVLWLVDLKKAYQSVLIESVNEAIAAHALESRPLMMPKSLVLADEAAFESVQTHCALLGIEVESLSPNTVCIRSLPPELTQVSLQIVLDKLTQVTESLSLPDLLRLIASCVQVPEVLDERQLQALLRKIPTDALYARPFDQEALAAL